MAVSRPTGPRRVPAFEASVGQGADPAGGSAACWMLAGLVHAALAFVVLSRLLTPTEGAELGEALWIAQIAPLTCVIWGAMLLCRAAARWRTGDPAGGESDSRPQLRWGWADLALALLVLGETAGAAGVFIWGGDRRGAVNVVWQWIGVGATAFVARQVGATRGWQSPLVRAVMAAAVSLSVVGIWEHHAGQDDAIRAYEQLTRRWDELQAAGRSSPPARGGALEREMQRLRQQMLESGIPFEPAERRLYEQRLKASREPLAFFALTNTLAGVLVGPLVLLIALLTAGPAGQGRRATRACGWGMAGAVVYCLLLTKSRTGFVGAAVGLSLWFALRLSQRSAAVRKMMMAGAVGLGLCGLMTAAVYLTGGLDRLVWTESGKSLRYRWEYWRGTWDVLSESGRNWTLGVGPGNFRQHYLRYKRPESSEEIFDPHDWLLDVWVNGGVLALSGGLGLLACLVVGYAKSRPGHEDSEEPGHATAWGEAWSGGSSDGWTAVGATAGYAGTFVCGSFVDERYLVAGVAWWGAWALLRALVRPEQGQPSRENVSSTAPPTSAAHPLTVQAGAAQEDESILTAPATAQSPAQRGAAASAGLGLLVHLLGAGGIAMPAVSQLVWLLAACAEPRRPLTSSDKRNGDTGHPPGTGTAARAQSTARGGMGRGVKDAAPAVAAIAAGLLLMLTQWMTAAGPVWQREAALMTGDGAAVQGNLARAEAAYRQAAAADPWSGLPHLRLAELNRLLWEQDRGDEARFSAAVGEVLQAIACDPRNHGGYRHLRDLYRGHWLRTHDQRSANGAWLAAGRAAELYPNSPRVQAERAVSAWEAGRMDEARTAASRALELHEINRRAGHIDKLLSEDRLRELDAIRSNTHGPRNVRGPRGDN